MHWINFKHATLDNFSFRVSQYKVFCQSVLLQKRYHLFNYSAPDQLQAKSFENSLFSSNRYRLFSAHFLKLFKAVIKRSFTVHEIILSFGTITLTAL